MSQIKKIIPLGLKKMLRSYAKKSFGFKEFSDLRDEFRKEILERKKRQEETIPKYDLNDQHIRNLKTILNRTALLKAMPVNAVCAEIGVNEGEFSQEILTVTRPEKLHLIDAWGDPGRYHDELKDLVRKKFGVEIKQGGVELNVGYSTDVLKTFPDAYFDWVYLDTDHTYATTSAELALLKNKMKPDGIIAGHDYIIGNWVGDFRYGVIEAVHELCVKDNWEIIYLTAETNFSHSFAIKKLS